MLTVHITECVLHKYIVIISLALIEYTKTRACIPDQNKNTHKLTFFASKSSTIVLKLRHENNLVILQ